MGYLPWHDGVGRRVGKRLRRIRKPKKPPDPKQTERTSKKKNKRSATRTRGHATVGDRIPLLWDPETPVEVLANFYARHAKARVVGGRRRTICNSEHRESRAADRRKHYKRECGLSTHSHNKQSAEKSSKEEPTNIPQDLDLPRNFGPGSIRHPITDPHNSAAQSSFAILAIFVLLPLLKLFTPAQHRRKPRKAPDRPRQKRSRSNPARKLLHHLPIIICLICSGITTWENNTNSRREMFLGQTLNKVKDRLVRESKVLQSGRGTALLA